MELARLEQAHLGAVELGKPGEEHRANGHVDADAEGVGAADDLEQAVLGQLFDEATVLRQHPGVVHPDAVADEPRERLAETGAEPKRPDAFGDGVALGAAGHVQPEESLGSLQGRGLGEVHDVDRGAFQLDQFLDGLVDAELGPRELQRHRAFGAGDERGLAPRASSEVLAKKLDLAQRGGHEHELGLGQLQ